MKKQYFALLTTLLLCLCSLELTACQSEPAISAYHTAQISVTPYIQSSVSYDYVLNTSTKKFHYPDCYSVDMMNEENKAHYRGTREEAIAKGYEPCGNCDP